MLHLIYYRPSACGNKCWWLYTLLMPWYNGDFPPSYKNQPVRLRNKAVEIANELLLHGADEGIAIATGLKKAREFFAKEKKKKSKTSKN
jgi:uncharacterized protein YdaT